MVAAIMSVLVGPGAMPLTLYPVLRPLDGQSLCQADYPVLARDVGRRLVAPGNYESKLRKPC